MATGPSSVDDAGATNVDVLLQELTRQVESLSVADCTLSCKALASMERARDRICELSPGARCEEARSKVASASEKVAAACPTCAAQRRPAPSPANDAKASAPPPAPSEGATVQSERPGGGCASCHVAGAGEHGVAGDAVLVLLATAAVQRISRRRRRNRPDARSTP